MKDLICPYCQKPFGWIVGEKRAPRSGDVLGCTNCGEVGRVTPKGSLRQLEPSEVEGLPERVKGQMTTFRRAIQRRQRARQVPFN